MCEGLVDDPRGEGLVLEQQGMTWQVIKADTHCDYWNKRQGGREGLLLSWSREGR